MKRYFIWKREGNLKAKSWESKIKAFFKKAGYIEDFKNPDVVIILGGDGTIVEGIREFIHVNPLFIGLNLGTVGFLASARKEGDFLASLKKFIAGKYFESERSVMEVKFKGELFLGLNDAVVRNLTNIVELDIYLDNKKIQEVRGDGVLVSTSMGSTAFNLSNHGPILMPNIKSFIVTEILDHNVPTPPIVIKSSSKIKIKIKNFRAYNELIFKKTGETIDVGLFVDGHLKAILEKGDAIEITRAKSAARLVEFSKNYFFDSVRNKFYFR